MVVTALCRLPNWDTQFQHPSVPSSQPRRSPASGPYPETAADRTRWIVNQRKDRLRHDVWRAHGSFIEWEPLTTGTVAETLTILLTSRECPWHCAMCDLWQFTVTSEIPTGAIAHQIEVTLAATIKAALQDPDAHLAHLASRQVKLYNGGSFFDPKAVPPADYPAIARLVAGFDRVIVECHPSLVGLRTIQFQALLQEAARHQYRPRTPVLEVAMGLETVHAETLEKLNKRMTIEQFQGAAWFLAGHEMAVRAFVLVQPPFQPTDKAVDWAWRSAEFAFNCGANAVTLIPTRFGNGALEALATVGEFLPPPLATLEDAFDAVLGSASGRVFVDLWNLEQFGKCASCLPLRRERLEAMNLHQHVRPRIHCAACGGG